MSCCGCLETPCRITNLYRHEELLEKFFALTGITIIQNTFICDPCVRLLKQAHSFRSKCIHIYENTGLGEETFADDLYNAEEIVDYETEFLDDDPLMKLEEGYGEEANDSSEDQTVYFARDEVKEKVLKNKPIFIEKQRADGILEVDDRSKPELCQSVEREECVTSEKTKRKSYFTHQKLEAIRYAEAAGCSNRQAAKVFEVDESCIRKWRQNKALLIEIDKERTAKRKPNLHWPSLDQKLKTWVMDQLNSGISIKPSQVKKKSIELADELNLDGFKGSNSYVFKFMRRYQFPGQALKKKPNEN